MSKTYSFPPITYSTTKNDKAFLHEYFTINKINMDNIFTIPKGWDYKTIPIKEKWSVIIEFEDLVYIEEFDSKSEAIYELQKLKSYYKDVGIISAKVVELSDFETLFTITDDFSKCMYQFTNTMNKVKTQLQKFTYWLNKTS